MRVYVSCCSHISNSRAAPAPSSQRRLTPPPPSPLALPPPPPTTAATATKQPHQHSSQSLPHHIIKHKLHQLIYTRAQPSSRGPCTRQQQQQQRFALRISGHACTSAYDISFVCMGHCNDVKLYTRRGGVVDDACVHAKYSTPAFMLSICV